MIDDENTNVVTAGAIVTVTVSLVRQNMGDLFGDTTAAEKEEIKDDDVTSAGAGGDGGEEEAVTAPPPVKRSAWSKPNKKPNKAASAPKKRGVTVKPKAQPVAPLAPAAKTVAKDTPADSDAESGDESDREPTADDAPAQSSDDEKKSAPASPSAGQSSVEDDDDEWDKFQQKLNRREKLEGKSKMSHSVHCPGYPEDKQEYWWTYICDRKSRTLLTAPYHVTNLVDSEEIQLKFTAPRWPGMYTFTVCLRSGTNSKFLSAFTTCAITFTNRCNSDSYMGMDQQQELKLDVKEAPVVPEDHPQWDISESESEKDEEQNVESEFTTDSSDNDE